MAGFYVLRDDVDTGEEDNPLKLPAFPYEAALALQDRMFKKDGSLFYPAFPGDPFYEGFIEEEGAELPSDLFPNGGPTALAEFFGNFITVSSPPLRGSCNTWRVVNNLIVCDIYICICTLQVNGKIWPKMEVEPRNYRLRLLNGCDSRFFVIQFAKVGLRDTDVSGDFRPLRFYVIGADQGLATEAVRMDTVVFEPGARLDIVFDFDDHEDSRILMLNLGPDEPYSGDPDDFMYERTSNFCRTNRIMAFDVVRDLDVYVDDDFDPDLIDFPLDIPSPVRDRKLALFEGTDEFGRLQPLLGTVLPATDSSGDPIRWPEKEAYEDVGLAGRQMIGTMGWHEPITELPKLGTTEEWEIWNVSADAHPIHLHGTFFRVLGRSEIVWDSATNEESRELEDSDDAEGDGTFLVAQPLVQHNGNVGNGFRIINPTSGSSIGLPDGHFEAAPKDMVIALPGQVTRILMTFQKPGRYVWHCHVLSHEDHEMMRVVQVVS